MCRIGDPTVPQRIVDRDQPAGADELQALLVIEVVALLVGVDESKIEAAILPRRAQPGERLGSRPETQVDALGDARGAPAALRHIRPLLARVAAAELALARPAPR